MAAMLEQAVVDRIRQLIDAGELSLRAIADQLRTSRKTVRAIKNGSRVRYGRTAVTPKWEPSLRLNQGPLRRCPGCGGKVHMPCRACEVARAIESGSAGPVEEPCVNVLLAQSDVAGLNIYQPTAEQEAAMGEVVRARAAEVRRGWSANERDGRMEIFPGQRSA